MDSGYPALTPEFLGIQTPGLNPNDLKTGYAQCFDHHFPLRLAIFGIENFTIFRRQIQPVVPLNPIKP
jgi:hypothetical protein